MQTKGMNATSVLSAIRDTLAGLTRLPLGRRICPVCGHSIEELILEVQIVRLTLSLLSTLAITGLLLLDLTSLTKPLVVTLALLTLTDILLRSRRLALIRRERSGTADPSTELDIEDDPMTDELDLLFGDDLDPKSGHLGHWQ